MIFIVIIITFIFSSIFLFFLLKANLYNEYRLTSNKGNYRSYETSIEENSDLVLFESILISDISFIAILVIISMVITSRIFHDIETEQKKQDNFISNSAHELKTPLAIMKATLESHIIQNENKNCKSVNCGNLIESLLEETDRLINITNSLYLISYNSQKDVANTTDNIELGEFIDNNVDKNDKRIIFKVGDKTYVNIKYELLIIIFSNLLRNSINHTKSYIKIDYGTTDTNKNSKRVWLSIQNDGNKIDIPINTIFDRFTKSDDSKGYGLGLSIVKEILDIYNYTIDVESNDDRTIFKIWFN